ncbi:MAG: hypothetical protein M3Q72_13600 [Actinomycetota bacterium]|nr:hypothetical protein [Actinomycetota bacterium]
MAAATTDVVNLILDDHRRFEPFFAELRDTTSLRFLVAARDTEGRSTMTKQQLLQTLAG